MNGVQIRVSDLIYAVVKRWKMILFLALVGCGFGVAWSGISYIRGNYTSYQINCSVALTSQSATGAFTSNSSYLTNNDFHLAEDMADAAIFVMQSDRVLNAAIEAANLTAVDAEDLEDYLTFERYNETQIVEIQLKWNNEESGLQLMNAILETSQEVLPETLMIGQVAVIDEPTVSRLAGGGGNLYMWPILGAAGLVFGLGITLLELIMRPTLVNLKDVEDVFGLETLGVIPHDAAFFRNKLSLSEEDGPDFAVTQNFASTAYILRNRFGAKEEQRSFYVTSTADGEGKSVVAANLAVAFADMEKRVLLLDLDTRNPCLGNLFLETTDYNRTLNALYKGEATIQEAIVSLTGYLDFLPAVLEYNVIPLDNTLFDFVRKLEENYDYVIIDAPSVGLNSDTLSLNLVAHAALFVIRYDTVPMPDIEDALNKLDKSGIRILGCVVNDEQSIKGLTFGAVGSSRTEERRNGKNKPASASMGDAEDTFSMSSDDDLLSRKSGSASEWPFREAGGTGFDILDELTNDPANDYRRISDEDALDALYQMGLDNSWKTEEEPEPEEEAGGAEEVSEEAPEEEIPEEEAPEEDLEEEIFDEGAPEEVTEEVPEEIPEEEVVGETPAEDEIAYEDYDLSDDEIEDYDLQDADLQEIDLTETTGKSNNG